MPVSWRYQAFTGPARPSSISQAPTLMMEGVVSATMVVRWASGLKGALVRSTSQATRAPAETASRAAPAAKANEFATLCPKPGWSSTARKAARLSAPSALNRLARARNSKGGSTRAASTPSSSRARKGRPVFTL